MAIDSPARDPRIDAVRGAALLMVLVDHVDYQLKVRALSPYTIGAFGFSDAAEIFVFLSGLVFGMSYERRLQRDGFVACQRRSLRRTAQIYAVYQIMVWLLLSAALVAIEWCPQVAAAHEIRRGVTPYVYVLEALRLRYQPFYCAILATYVMILPFMPVLLRLQKTHSSIAWTISLVLYLAAQFLPGLQPTIFPSNRASAFNPFAWQFLFFLGFAWRGELPKAMAKRLVGAGVASCVLIGGVVHAKVMPYLNSHFHLLESPNWLDVDGPFVYKPTLGPLRLLHFISLVYIVSMISHRGKFVWRPKWGNPVVVMGRYSLETYFFGMLLTAISSAYPCLMGHPSAVEALAIDVDMCVLCALWAFIVHWYYGQKRRRGNRDGAHSAEL
jgi:hypothetical protein